MLQLANLASRETKLRAGRNKLKKTKMVMVVLMAVLVILVINEAVPMLVQTFQGGGSNAGFLTVVHANVSINVTQIGGTYFGADKGYQNTYLQGDFIENGDDTAYGNVTATLQVSATKIYTQTTNVTFPPGISTYVQFTFYGVEYEGSYIAKMSFTATTGQTTGVTPTPTVNTGGGGGGGGGGTYTKPTPTKSAAKAFNYGTLALPLVAIVVAVVGGLGGFMIFKRTRLSESKVRNFTSYAYQDWVMQRLRAHAGSVLDSRRGIDGFTGGNLPLAIKQSDVGRLQVDSFMNALTQTRGRSGVMVAFGYDNDARAAVSRARINRVDIKLLTVKELVEHKNIDLL